MIPTILIVDDDQVWLRLLSRKLEGYAERFNVQLAENSEMAIEVLRQHPIALVVTDLQMPGMGGLALLAYLSEFYPDIAVIIITAHSTPESKKAVLEKGAAGYLEKPFIIEELAQKILAALDKIAGGGTLRSVQLSTFAQLLEIEQKTCTIRVQQKETGQLGVLFFFEGVLLESRIAGMRGLEAAYAIFSWPDVVLSIEDNCLVKEKRIADDLQAILMEAMYRRDEQASASADRLSDTPNSSATATMGAASTDEWVLRLQKALGSRHPVEPYTDAAWDELIQHARWAGEQLDAGNLKIGCVDLGKEALLYLLPGSQTHVVEVNRRFSPDRVLKTLLG